MIDRAEITPDRHAFPYFWVPAGCETGTPSGKPGPDASPVPSRQGDTGWLLLAHRGGGGNRTRVLRLLNRHSPSAAGCIFSGPPPLPAPAMDPRRPVVFPTADRQNHSGKSYVMTPVPDP